MKQSSSLENKILEKNKEKIREYAQNCFKKLSEDQKEKQRKFGRDC